MNKLLSGGEWEVHPWTRTSLVRHCPIWLLESISNKNAADDVSLTSGKIEHQDIVWDRIKKNGMAEPLLIIIDSKHKTIQLETGNHRIHTAKVDGYTHLPVAVQVIDDYQSNRKTRRHLVDALNLVYWDRLRDCSYPKQVDSIEVLNFNEFKNIADQNINFMDFVI